MNPEGKAEEKAAPTMGAPAEAAATKRVSGPTEDSGLVDRERASRSPVNSPLSG
jgi:hypothetical protein